MKRLIITIVLTLASAIFIIFDIPNKNFFFGACVVLIFINQYLLFLSITTRAIDGQIKISSQKRSIDYFTIFMTMVWVVFFFRRSIDYLYIVIIAGAYLAAEVAGYFLYRYLKPATLIICNAEIIVSGLFVVKRNLEDLTRLDLNGITKRMECSFLYRPGITINYGDYIKEDIDMVIDLMIRTSKHEVKLTDNLKR